MAATLTGSPPPAAPPPTGSPPPAAPPPTAGVQSRNIQVDERTGAVPPGLPDGAYVDQFGNSVTVKTNPDGSQAASTTSTYKGTVRTAVQTTFPPDANGNVKVVQAPANGGTVTTTITAPDGSKTLTNNVNDVKATYNPDGTRNPDVHSTTGAIISPAEANVISNNTSKPLGGGGLFGLEGPAQVIKGLFSDSGIADQLKQAMGTMTAGNVSVPAFDSSRIDAGGQASQSLANQFNNAYQNFQPTQAPVAQAAQLGPQTFAQAGQVGYVPQVQAPNVGSAQQVQAATVGQFLQAAGAAVQAGTATAQQIGALERVQPGIVGQIRQAAAQQVGPIERVQGVNVEGAPQVSSGGPVTAQQANATTLDAQQQAEFRQNQKTLLGYLSGAIDGTAPSVAKLQLDEATQRNEANQLGIASAASRGGNSALAMRTAANNIGMLNQKAAADAALLRAQEVATARGQYGDVANTGRTADVSIAGQNAGLQTGVSQTNAQLGTQANITGATLGEKASEANAGNAVSINSLRAQLAQQAQTTNANNNLAAGTTNATLGTQVSLGNAKNQLDAQSLQAQLNQQASTANAGNSLAAQTTNATLGTQSSIANANNVTSANTATANNATQASVANSNNSLSAQIAQAKLTQDASTSNAANATSLQQLQAQLLYNASHDNAGNALSAEQTNANLQTQASTTNANNATNLTTTQGQLSNAANLANAANQVTTAGQNITAQQNAAGNQLTAQGQVNSVNANVLDNQTKLQAQQMDMNAKQDAAGLGALGALGSAVLSDKRAKTNIRDGRGDAQDLLDHLTARSFRYKDPSNGAGEQTGVMAQDVEKSKAGKAFVADTSRGKALDPTAGFGSVLAMLSTLNERTKKLEARRG